MRITYYAIGIVRLQPSLFPTMKSKFLKPLLLSLVTAISAVCSTASPAVAQTSPPPYAQYYDPATGFKPAQRDLTKIFMQLAGSLEHHGTPEPYIRHVIAEHERIAAKYKAATGKNTTARPEYLTDEFIENLLANWQKLDEGLKLEALSLKTGKNMRLAIMGTWNMPVPELASLETGLAPSEASAYSQLLGKRYFAKTDLAAVDAFYKGPYDKLSDTGKAQLSKRVMLGTLPPDKRDAAIQNDKGGSLIVGLLNSHQEQLTNYMSTEGAKLVNADTMIATLKNGLKLDQEELNLAGMNEFSRDAFQYSHAVRADFVKRFDHIRQNQPKDTAEGTVDAVYAMVDNLAVIAHSELKAALLETRAK